MNHRGTGTGFSQSSSVFPVHIIPPLLSILIYHLGMNNRSVGGRSSETSAHPIDMNNNNNNLPNNSLAAESGT
jgi:hypothetical protein